jgi:hypothetical protein
LRSLDIEDGDIGGGRRIIHSAGAEIRLGRSAKSFWVVRLEQGDHEGIALESFPTANLSLVENRFPHSLNRPPPGFGFERIGGFPLRVFEGAAIDRIGEPLVVVGAGDAGRFGSTNDCARFAECSQERTLI